jgi:hypothetical protein
MTERYAVYYAPRPDSPLWRFGSSVIAYDAATGADLPPLVPKGFSEEGWRAATADPRRYGFHATLKAPFRLADGHDEAGLAEALHRVAAQLTPADLGPAGVHVVPAEEGGGFVAITPTAPPPALAAIERAVVKAFEPFRAPLTAEEVARRRPDRLTARQRAHLEAYGYPFVLDDFAFHMTLSGRLEAPAPVAADLGAWAEAAAVLEGGLRLDRLALFRQDGPSRRFRIVTTAEFRAG